MYTPACFFSSLFNFFLQIMIKKSGTLKKYIKNRTLLFIIFEEILNCIKNLAIIEAYYILHFLSFDQNLMSLTKNF